MIARSILCILLATAAATEAALVHVVAPGDSLPKLVWLYRVSADSILAANHLPSDTLQPGQRLVIPGDAAPRQAAPVQAAEPMSRPAEPVATARAEALPEARPELTPSAPNFRAAIAIPASNGIRYNGRWVPPGESKAWVMDCSNTSRWLYQEVKSLDLPRTASDQYEWLRQRNRLWKVRPDPGSLRKKLQPGDLLFWENTYKPPRRPPITHVMVYLGTDADGHMRMAGSQGSSGPDVYDFEPGKRMGGYRFFFFFRRDGKFVAYGRP